MRKFTKELTYTNIVGTLALFIALGGVSWAASLPKNSVGSAQLKKNAVTGKAIKDKTITGSDFKSATISGSKLNLAALGVVPSATHAASADSVGGEIVPVVKRVAPSSNDPSMLTALHSATEVPLISNGQVSLVGKCFTSGSSVYGYIVARTSDDGALASISAGPSYTGSPGYLNAGQPDEMSYALQSSVGSNGSTPLAPGSHYGVGTLVGRDGKGLQFQVNGWLKNGTPAAGDGAYGSGNVCIFMAGGSKI